MFVFCLLNENNRLPDSAVYRQASQIKIPLILVEMLQIVGKALCNSDYEVRCYTTTGALTGLKGIWSIYDFFSCLIIDRLVVHNELHCLGHALRSPGYFSVVKEIPTALQNHMYMPRHIHRVPPWRKSFKANHRLSHNTAALKTATYLLGYL
jgi:hypothetical protein